MKSYFVYIMTSKPRGVLYVGVTSGLEKRVYEHKQGLVKGFTEKYKVKKLVYFEETDDILSTINREKRLKGWKREWKIKLIEEKNPQWRDLFFDL